MRRTRAGPRAVWGLVRPAGCVKTGARCGPGEDERRGGAWSGPAGARGLGLRPGAAAVMAQQQMTSSQKALMLELKSLQEEPVEGFRITLVDESDLYNWEVAIFGPPNTLYEGGYFKVPPPLPALTSSGRGLSSLPLAGPRVRARVCRGGSSPRQPPSPHSWKQEGLAHQVPFLCHGGGGGRPDCTGK